MTTNKRVKKSIPKHYSSLQHNSILHKNIEMDYILNIHQK